MMALKGPGRTVRGSGVLNPRTTCTNARMEGRKTTKMSNKLSSVFQKVKESFIPKGTCHFPPSPTKIEHTDDEQKPNRSAIQSQKALKWIQGRLLHDCLCRESSCYRVNTRNPSGTDQLWNFQIWQLNKSGRSLCGTRAASCVCQGWAAHMRGPQRWWRASAHFWTDPF